MKSSMSYDKNFNKRVKTKLKGYVTRSDINALENFAKEGVYALSKATPSKTGETASSWYYDIVEEKNKTSIIWCNSHVENGVNIAVVLDSGHATQSGSWVKGYDYIESAIAPIREKIEDYLNNK